MATKLTSMKLPPRKPSAEEKRYPTMCDPSDEPEYPYGLSLSLDETQLDALGLKELPKVGSAITIQAKAEVTGVTENQTQGGTRRSLNIQITDLGLD